MTYKMTQEQLDKIITLGCEERYDYFLNKVADWSEMWILVNEDDQFLKMFSEDDNIEYLPVWPHPDFALAYCSDSEESLSPKKITLPLFFKRWIPGLENDELSVSVFPNLEETIWLMEPAELQADLEEALSQ